MILEMVINKKQILTTDHTPHHHQTKKKKLKQATLDLEYELSVVASQSYHTERRGHTVGVVAKSTNDAATTIVYFHHPVFTTTRDIFLVAKSSDKEDLTRMS